MLSVRRAGCALAAALCAIAAGTACGKKGAPLAPFVQIPAAVTTITATRLGSDVYVTLTVPVTNIDTSIPADIGRIEVYAYTGRTAPLPARFVELGDLVATIPVAPPPPLPGQPVPVVPPPDAAARGALQGLPVTVLDTLTADELVPGRVPPLDPRRPALIGAVGVPATGALRRFYMAISFSRRGRPGPPGTSPEVALTAVPLPPTDVRATYGATTMTLVWEPSGGLLGFLLDAPLPAEPLPFDEPPVTGPALPPVADAAVPPGPTRYHVYRELAPDPLALPLPGTPRSDTIAPVAINVPQPILPATSMTEAIELGRGRCYTVRAMRGAAISDASPPTCITPVDIFPPAIPAGLAAVPSEGGISLIWEPNSELDLGGYLVLRREGGDATLRLLTDTPIADARFRDTAVTPGMRYIYSVVAVDSQLPLPNVSAESAQVEETAR